MKTYQQYMRLLGYVRPYRKLFAFAILATVVMAAAEATLPMLLEPLIDGSFVEKDPQMIVLMPILMVVVFTVRGLATIASTVAMESVATKVVFTLREKMFRQLLLLPKEYYDDNSSGVILSKITFDVEQLTQAASRALVILVRDSLIIIGLLSYILYVNWKLALITFAIIPVVALLVRVISRRLRRIHRELQRRMGVMTHTLEEVISGYKIVRLFGGQGYESRRFRDTANKVRLYRVKNVIAASANVQVIQIVASAALALIAYLAAQQSAAGEFTAGEFVSFFTAMAMLLSPLKKLTGINAELQRGLAAAESVFQLIDEIPEADDGHLGLQRSSGKIEWRNVSFRFNEAESPALSDINLTISPGENIALVGPSGSGKTTLTNLIPRFYRPSQGELLIDDIDITEIPLESLRQQISMVSQDIVLFNGSIETNIAYGALQGTERAHVIEAAKAANAWQFIQEMPEGLDTLIGDNGVKLSGGQRQRIAIARAILKDAPLLIFDEATSALDTESEQQIQGAMERLRQGRTTLTIAHRLSTIEHADRILVMQEGRIIEQGSHAALLQQEGLYRKLHDLQYAGRGT